MKTDRSAVQPPPPAPDSKGSKSASHRAAIGENMGRLLFDGLALAGEAGGGEAGRGARRRLSPREAIFRPDRSLHATRFPRWLVWSILALCLLPALLVAAGADFGIGADAAPGRALLADPVDRPPAALAGVFVHTLLEWTAFCGALFIVLLAFVHYRVTRDIVTPLIATVLFWAGCMDALHVLTADNLIRTAAGNRDLLPFSWAVFRFFNALMLTVGGAILRRRPDGAGARGAGRPKGSALLIGLAGALFALAAYGAVHYFAVRSDLPKAVFSAAAISRPFDLAPLLVYVAGGLFVLPALYARVPSLFSFALVLSIVPHAAAQLHMALGSTVLFDSHFNIAHFLKIVAYFVPLLGLVMDYLRVYRKEEEITGRIESEIADRRLAEEKLIRSVGELARSNRELDDFAYIASHDLKEPLRGISNYSQFLLEDYGGRLDEEGRRMLTTLPALTARLEKLINELLNYSRVGRMELAWEETDLDAVLDDVLVSLRIRLDERSVEIRKGTKLPVFLCDRVRIGEVFRNLVTNGMKYNDKERKWIEIGLAGSDPERGEITVYVRDNGIGIPEKHRDKVFAFFKRLHGRDEYGGGTGAGMSIVKKIVERHHGTVWLESAVGEGSTFFFTLGRGGEIDA